MILVSVCSSSMMPRRPSASQGVFHRTSDSLPSVAPMLTSTPQTRVVQVLVNRLRSKLPCNSGLSLDRLESDPPTQQAVASLVELSKDSLGLIAWALCELLERLSKQHDQNNSVEVLTSQLFLLKVLAATMASRWNVTPTAIHSNGSRAHRTALSDPSASPPWQEPPPLEDSCAKYIISVMALVMRQAAPSDMPLMLQTRSTDISFRDFDVTARGSIVDHSAERNKRPPRSAATLPAMSATYENTHMSLVRSPSSVNQLLAKYAGRVVFHVSASNWLVVSERLQSKITNLAATEKDISDLVDLQLLAHCLMDRARLLHLLHQLSSLLVNLKKDALISLSYNLRAAIWNWIDIFPEEFNEVVRTRGKMEGTPERVFDLFYSMIVPGQEKVFWPTLTILNCLTSDRIAADLQYGAPGMQLGGHSRRKEVRFTELIVKHLGGGSARLSEIALACVVDICRAATYVDPKEDVPLKAIVSDIAHEIKDALQSSPGGRGKTFWDSQEDIDVALYADALVSIYRFLPVEDSKQLFLSAMEMERSDPVKTCVIRALLTLVQDESRFNWQRPVNDLAASLAVRTREIIRDIGFRRGEVDQYGTQRRVAMYPRAKRVFSEPLSDREVLILGILSLWRSRWLFLTYGLNSEEEIDAWVPIPVKVWEAPIDISVKISVTYCQRILTEATFGMPTQTPEQDPLSAIVRLSYPVTLLSVVTNLWTTRQDVTSQKLWIAVGAEIVESYASSAEIPQLKAIQMDPRRVPALILAEIAFLLSLPSADTSISTMAAKGLRSLAHAERQANVPISTIMSDEDRSKRDPVYEQLGDPRVTVVGRVATQKRIRKLIRLLSSSSGMHVVVWQECYWRWKALNEILMLAMNAEGGDLSSVSQDIRSQWQNYALFLAALSRSCLHEHQDLSALKKAIPPRLLPDKIRTLSSPGVLLGDFVSELINYVDVGDVQTRDTVRDALGIELSPRLYGKMIRDLEDTVMALHDRDASGISKLALLLDQIISILKLVTENEEATLEEVMNVELGSIMQTLVNFLSRFTGVVAQRIKMKFCILVEGACSRTDTLTIRKDSPVRHEILDIVLGWMEPGSESDPRDSLQQDLNMASLRAAVRLLDKLQLKPAETATGTGDDIMHVVSRLFNKYSTALLSSLTTCLPDSGADNGSEFATANQRARFSQREAELRELIITGLTHLVSANTESGFKQCLSLAYDPDNRKRTIFAHVFSRVIGQGTVFHPEDKSVTKARHTALAELVKAPDLVLAMTICEICPQSEVETMISVLLNIFDTRHTLMPLIKAMIEREVQQTDDEIGLFRSNSMCTRFLSAFAKLHGYNYLRGLIDPLLSCMRDMPPGTSYEIDPSKVLHEDIPANQKNVEYVAAQFINVISDSLDSCPGMFREICAHIGEVVAQIWPDSKYAAMGSFMFLRFISPAVVTPEILDLPMDTRDNAPALRKGLMVIAKIIQNLANNIFFGKEPHMRPLNKFLQSNITNVTTFLSELKKHPDSVTEGDPWSGAASDDTDVIVLHRFFHKHADKIGKELLSLSKPGVEGADSSAIVGKRAWDGLCALLVDLGPPMEVPRLSNLRSEEHREFMEILNKFSGRSMGSVAGLFVETDIQNPNSVFVLRLSNIDVESLDIELFMCHILKTLSSDYYRDRQFEIILDCTSFNSKSEIPLQWLKYCAELIPIDIRMRFRATRILNPNSLMAKYLRRLYNISAGATLCGEIKIYSSVVHLLDDVQATALPSISYPASLEQEPHEVFHDVQVTAPKVNVSVRVGTSHIRITSDKSLPISPGLSCQTTEIIPFTDISDIYNISMNVQTVNEFIIRRRVGETVYLSSPTREAIIKAIRLAKSRVKEAQPPLAERFSRFSNVPATLLHIGFLSVDLNDEELRGAAYALLHAVCNYLKFDKNPIVAAKAGFVPGDPMAYVIRLSDKLARFSPQLTLDFVQEVSTAMIGMDRSAVNHRLFCLQYMSPWIPNLAHFANPSSPLFERSGARLRDCVRTLADLTINIPEITSSVQRHVWSEVSKLDSHVVDRVLDELVRTAVDSGIGSRSFETVSFAVAALSSIHVRGRVYSKLRKAISRVSTKICTSLTDYPNWTEISCLIRLCMVVGSQSSHAGLSYLYVPEMVHQIALVAGEGPALVRKSAYATIVNLLQGLYVSRPDDSSEPGLTKLINECSTPQVLKLFGLARDAPTSDYTSVDPMNEKETLDNAEALVQFLIRLMDVSAGTNGLLNVWKARWMGLVASTAFQLSPAVQTRSFIVLGALATDDVDDDFLYQILVALRSGLGKAQESNTMAIISMLRCICKVIPAIADSRYVPSLFWLSVALLESSHVAFYVEATELLQATLQVLERQGVFERCSVHAYLLAARESFEEITCQLDEILQLSFHDSFSFSLASILFKGLRHKSLRGAAESALRTLLQLVSTHEVIPEHNQRPPPEALGYFIALLPVSTSMVTYHRLLEDARVEILVPASEDDERVPQITMTSLGIENATMALLCASFAGTILATAQGNDAESEMLYGLLANMSPSYPEVISLVYDTMQDRVKDTFANCSNAAILHSVSHIFRVALQDPGRGVVAGIHQGSTSTLGTVEEHSSGPGKNHLLALEELGMQGLANNLSFLPLNRGFATKMIQWIPQLVEALL